ncbi:uncharacterized protein TrAFT101_002107 [Trichoderma asperellum]|uniref:Uncharacterized protein n=1 Tax=Trichoderma asperellum (strain ATCC 204424 / CBS 433.97 / NBRC 101777) TaxID=1042311 RepID=A0A2T3ZFF9_TRIA4|nr:hypothetical protein M441DRAFT_78538 [Trichoderma asperellum CBS 433.97]PTB43547.1 hypothetical protein M441DRAFT_78538 [Trichoderma asperellum CBS 433.97]UKZ86271.1 hypothetical protein TrAFT101_002107 [Trichoderma asperellum]
MCYALTKSKQLVKSLLSAGDGWKLRIANNPFGELGHKGNNMKVNMNKNDRLRQITLMKNAPGKNVLPGEAKRSTAAARAVASSSGNRL